MHPIIALSVLEAVRASDLAKGDPSDGYHSGQEAVKLGRTASVAAQIDRYSAMVRRNNAISAEELAGLFTLVSRRSDADLVFGDAGRRAGRHAAKRTALPLRILNRLLPRGFRARVGRRLVRRAAVRVLAAALATFPLRSLVVHSSIVISPRFCLEPARMQMTTSLPWAFATFRKRLLSSLMQFCWSLLCTWPPASALARPGDKLPSTSSAPTTLGSAGPRTWNHPGTVNSSLAAAGPQRTVARHPESWRCASILLLAAAARSSKSAPPGG